MTYSFSKMSGAGNDFVVIDNRRLKIRQRARLARQVCDRHEGIGADGLLLLEPSRRYSYLMRYYNADGTDGGMCGNGARCIAWFAFLYHIAPRNHTFEALGKPYAANILGKERVSIAFPDPAPLHPTWKVKTRIPGNSRVSFIDTGSPHAVVRLRRESLSKFNVVEAGRSLRWDPTFQPLGTNVNYVQVNSATSITIRTYERGVEAETRACGTGSIACAVTGSELWGLKSPVRVEARGGILKVSFTTSSEGFTDILLEGHAKIVFEGTLRA